MKRYAHNSGQRETRPLARPEAPAITREPHLIAAVGHL